MSQHLLRVDASGAFTPTPFGIFEGVSTGSSAPGESCRGCVSAWSGAHNQLVLCRVSTTCTSARKGGRQAATEMPILWEAVVEEVLDLLAASQGRRGYEVDVPQVPVGSDSVERPRASLALYTQRFTHSTWSDEMVLVVETGGASLPHNVGACDGPCKIGSAIKWDRGPLLVSMPSCLTLRRLFLAKDELTFLGVRAIKGEVSEIDELIARLWKAFHAVRRILVGPTLPPSHFGGRGGSVRFPWFFATDL